MTISGIQRVPAPGTINKDRDYLPGKIPLLFLPTLNPFSIDNGHRKTDPLGIQ
jgi:hypothetical protein